MSFIRQIWATSTNNHLTLPSIDNTTIAKKLGILNLATRAATPGLELPRPDTLDVNERGFLEYFRTLMNDGGATVRARLADFEADRRKLCRIAFPNLSSGAGEDARHELSVHRGNCSDEIKDAYQLVEQAIFDMGVFRRDNDPISLPHSESLYHVALTGVVAVGLEGLTNAHAFGVMRGGLLVGTALSLVLACANVAAGFGWGLAIRELGHRKFWRKLLGAAALSAYVAFLSSWSLLVAEYRSALLIDSEGAGERAVEALSLPLPDLISSALHSFEAVLLWGVTVGCSIVSVTSVFVYAPYPGYLRVASQLARANALLREARANYRNGIETVVDPVLESVDDKHDRALEARSSLDDNIRKTEECIADYEAFCRNVADAAATCITEYRRTIAATRRVEVSPYKGAQPDVGKAYSTDSHREGVKTVKVRLEEATINQLLTRDLAAAEAEIRLAKGAAQADADGFFEECKFDSTRPSEPVSPEPFKLPNDGTDEEVTGFDGEAFAHAETGFSPSWEEFSEPENKKSVHVEADN